MLKQRTMSILTVLFILVISTAAEAKSRSSNITVGSSLTPTSNSSWPSPSGLYAFGFFPQHVNNYAVGIFLPDKTVVWAAKRDSNLTVPEDVVSLFLTPEGLILRQRQGPDIVVIGRYSTIASASMLDNGNFVLYNSNHTIIWQSFDYPTNTLLPGQRLTPGKEIVSSASETDYSRGSFRLKMQTDGYLVQYPVGTEDTATYAYYAENPDGAVNVSLNFDSAGRLYQLINGSLPLRNISNGRLPTEGYINFMRLDVGGIFRIYSFSISNMTTTRRWSSIVDECAPKGFCGVNAFCILMDNVPECQCLPGFVSVQPGNRTAPCSRTFSVQDCPNTDDGLRSEMLRVKNTEWDETWYENRVMTEEECSKACLDDCNCEAAMYVDSECRKQRLPLRFGRRSLGKSNVAFVRVSKIAVRGLGGRKIIVQKEGGFNILIIGIVLLSIGILALSISVVFVRLIKRKDYNKIGKENVD